jgi:hypothetical protein
VVSPLDQRDDISDPSPARDVTLEHRYAGDDRIPVATAAEDSVPLGALLSLVFQGATAVGTMELRATSRAVQVGKLG